MWWRSEGEGEESEGRGGEGRVVQERGRVREGERDGSQRSPQWRFSERDAHTHKTNNVYSSHVYQGTQYIQKRLVCEDATKLTQLHTGNDLDTRDIAGITTPRDHTHINRERFVRLGSARYGTCTCTSHGLTYLIPSSLAKYGNNSERVLAILPARTRVHVQSYTQRHRLLIGMAALRTRRI